MIRWKKDESKAADTPEINPRRLANSERALRREREKLPLFSEHIAQSQPTAEERLVHIHERWQRTVKGIRDHSAQCWRKARKTVRSWPQEHRAQAIRKWNGHGCPATGVYFANFIRGYARENGLPFNKED